MNNKSDKDSLRAEYIAILQAWLKENEAAKEILNLTGTNTPQELSNLFLTSVPSNIDGAKHRIMIVGREARGWNKENNKALQFDSIEQHVDSSLKKHREFLERMLYPKNNGSTPHKEKRIPFMEFIKKISKRCGAEGIIYSNLLCLDWNQKTIPQNYFYKEILEISKQLLKAQISFFRPDIIIFANGISSRHIRRAFFPLDDGQEGKDYKDSNGISNIALWSFNLPESSNPTGRKIICYRIHHPSSYGRTSSMAAKAREFLVKELLPNKN
jgi:hypothetical protein